MRKLNTILALAGAGVMLVSCGDNKKAGAGDTTTVEEVETVETPAAVDGVQIVISGDDQMKFDTNEIKVPVGEKVTLTLKHSGKMDKAVMGHNWVLLKQGTDLVAFATEAGQAAETDYIPESGKENVIAFTKVLGGGESDTIEFTIDEAGTYDFLCSFPAHFAMMKGKLIAE